MLTQDELSSALNRRIDEAGKLVEDYSNASLHWFLYHNKYPCRVNDVSVLTGANKKSEKGGIQYELIIGRDESFEESYTVLVNVWIAPRRGSSDEEIDKRGNGAYVAVYAVDANGEQDLITWFDVNESNLNQNMETKQWYDKWLEKALQHKKASKLMKYKKPFKQSLSKNSNQ